MQAQDTFSPDFFENISFFSGLSADELDLLRVLFIFCDVNQGDALFAQGKPAEFLYIVVSGKVEVRYKPDDGPALTVAHVEPGGIVGWSSALGSQVYTSGAVAATCSRLLRVRGSDLRNICERYPGTGAILLDRLAAVIAERLRNTHPQVKAMLESALGLVNVNETSRV
jgi:CRP-like cAMP-binding protein